MKKIMVILVALSLICGVTILSAQAADTAKAKVNTEMVKGKIVSIDAAKNEMVVKENKTGTEKTIAVDPKVISSLAAGEEVKVTLKAGSNVAEKIKKITEVTAPAQKASK